MSVRNTSPGSARTGRAAHSLVQLWPRPNIRVTTCEQPGATLPGLPGQAAAREPAVNQGRTHRGTRRQQPASADSGCRTHRCDDIPGGRGIGRCPVSSCRSRQHRHGCGIWYQCPAGCTTAAQWEQMAVALTAQKMGIGRRRLWSVCPEGRISDRRNTTSSSAGPAEQRAYHL
jgi:hypothetical protein